MDNLSLSIMILSLLCIVGLIYLNFKKNKENFQDAQCNFTYDGNSRLECLDSCIQASETNKCTGKECLDRCPKKDESCIVRDNNNKVLYTTCNINSYLDIGGQTIEKCVNKCTESTCDGCKNFSIRDPQTNRLVTGSYTNNLNDYLTKCDSQIINHKFCSPCVEACYLCSNKNKCQWIEGTDETKENKQTFNSTEFTIWSNT